MLYHVARIFVSPVIAGLIRHEQSLTRVLIATRVLLEIGIDGADVEMRTADGDPII